MGRRCIILIFILLLQGSHFSLRSQDDSLNLDQVKAEAIQLELPHPIMMGVEERVSIELQGHPNLEGDVSIRVSGDKKRVSFRNGTGIFKHRFEKAPLTVKVGQKKIEEDFNAIPLWSSILPPLLAIVLALLLREVYSSLFAGVFLGAAISACYSSGFSGIFIALFRSIDTYILGAINDSGHLSVILFSMMIGGVVALISRNGGMQGVVDRISRGAVTPKSGQLSTWGLGLTIFFDDYANTLVVGNTMRPVTDRLRISREKLAYLVDSTAAPIAAVAFITTWIGAELGYIQGAMDTIAAKQEGKVDESVYSIFMNSLAYSFYPLLTLLFIPMLVLKGRDFGPMLKAERLARLGRSKQTKNDPEQEEERAYKIENGLTPNGWFALLPILTIVLGTFLGLIITGSQKAHSLLLEQGADVNRGLASVWMQLQELERSPEGFFGKLGALIGNSDAYSALLWASLGALVLTILMTVISGRMKLEKSIEALLDGFRTMLGTIVVLVLAWSLALVTEHLHTAEMLTSLMGTGIAPWGLPAIAFVLAAIVAFSTGSSWGTMAILYPLMLPAAWQLGMDQLAGPDAVMPIFYNVTSCVLAGSVLGDHCSPISDTTILSSLASSCDHIEHVRTQMPYALTVGIVSLLLGTIPSALGVPFWISFPAGILVLYAIVHFLGKATEEELPFDAKD